MSDICKTPYGTWARIYRELGMWPRPLKYPGIDEKGKPLGKACKEKNWTTPDAELPPGTLEHWEERYAGYNMGLLMGSPLPDGTLLGALDIDHDKYVSLGRALLSSPPCGRIGKKGAVFFVRFHPSLKSKKFRVKGKAGEEYGQVAELLFAKTLCVIPPSIHPNTSAPYRWDGIPLHQIEFSRLPYIGE